MRLCQCAATPECRKRKPWQRYCRLQTLVTSHVIYQQTPNKHRLACTALGLRETHMTMKCKLRPAGPSAVFPPHPTPERLAQVTQLKSRETGPRSAL